MLINMDSNGKVCWATIVKNTLFSLGFGYAWLNQGVGCETSFFALFKQRMIDHFLQEWYSSVLNKDTYSTYCLFKTSFEPGPYFEFLDYRCFRDYLVKLRVGVLPINGSSFRRTFSESHNKLCPLCDVIEDENHFIFVCPMYAEIRNKYLRGTSNQYYDVLKNGPVKAVRNISFYLFYATRKRLNNSQNTVC